MHRDQAAPEQTPAIRELLLSVIVVRSGTITTNYLGNTIGLVHLL